MGAIGLSYPDGPTSTSDAASSGNHGGSISYAPTAPPAYPRAALHSPLSTGGPICDFW